ncbi:hypothetical protein ACE1AT_20520 [Pelatocladus sp. BLCC-F211]|uniref:hypothetical protein n=1 Tax=Pelatocladus sp. BLCC-F211 TaxID=3342752 RepID=UPI0035B99468
MNINNLHDKNIKKWCQENGWTNLFTQGGQLYAFPPGAVIPLPLPIVNIEPTKIFEKERLEY